MAEQTPHESAERKADLLSVKLAGLVVREYDPNAAAGKSQTPHESAERKADLLSAKRRVITKTDFTMCRCMRSGTF